MGTREHLSDFNNCFGLLLNGSKKCHLAPPQAATCLFFETNQNQFDTSTCPVSRNGLDFIRIF